MNERLSVVIAPTMREARQLSRDLGPGTRCASSAESLYGYHDCLFYVVRRSALPREMGEYLKYLRLDNTIIEVET